MTKVNIRYARQSLSIRYAGAILILLSLSGCANRRTELEQILISENTCWKFADLENPSERISVNLCMRFFAHGTFRMFVMEDGKIQATSPSVTGQDYEKWSLLNQDRAIEIKGIRYNIISYSPDTIRLGHGDEVHLMIRSR